ncbi:tautomerase family protein [Enemella sp. A6]|uniref:tautomerase family protein n=1 Tax=Enemella sp. A6 TaxID=3440152 RepID=UPI003EBC7844
MPLVEVTLTEGRAPEKLRAMITAITNAVATSIDAPQQNVRVIIREVPETHFAAGDQTIAERNAAANS